MTDLAPQPTGTIPLPSQSSAAALVGGDVTALPMVMLHLVGRAALIGTGLAIAGERDAARAIKYSLAGATVIEVFVVLHEVVNRRAQP